MIGTTQELKEQASIIPYHTLSYFDYYKESITTKFKSVLDNIIEITDYPYGRLRTTMKVWIEHTTKGSRLVMQSLNPKTNKWNKEHKSTYNDIEFLTIEDNGHYGTISLNFNDGESKAVAFLELFKEQLSKEQLLIISRIIGYEKTMKYVTFKMIPSNESKDDSKEQEEIKTRIKKNMQYETAKTYMEMKKWIKKNMTN